MGRDGRSSTRQVRNRWPNGVVPYTLDSAFNEEFRTLIAAAITAIQDTTCIRWRPKTEDDQDWVNIYTTGVSGCFATFGLVAPGYGAHELALQGPTACNDKVSHIRVLYFLPRTQGVIIHEMMHNLGVAHEQQRPERDSYISMLWPNVQLDKADQYWRDSYQTEAVQTK